MPDLRVLPLDESQLARAYPLVRSAARVSPERWTLFARELIAGGDGILAVQADDGCLHGLAAFRQLGSLRHELSLQVEILVTFELSRHCPVRKALCAALEALARRKGCRSIVFTMAAQSHADRGSACRASWEELGARMETVGFVQPVTPHEACP